MQPTSESIAFLDEAISDINQCIGLLYQLDKQPIYLYVLTTGVQFNLGIEHTGCCWQIVSCTDKTYDLLYLDGDAGTVVGNGTLGEIKIVFNTIIWYASLPAKDVR